ncbi:glycosyltransferase [Leifsonia xyli subsp. cynodontis DSM 46306]|uniref:Uncharacterized protein n=1 Tax=Leifsonia xyli subsp. cynodontis DSM 46306 TaxID=1389489 RepID=U3P5W0_LEIXC|nr:glycosyltransferase [Leifsonia xyli subsp. cynodontis DSM 46306]
MHDEVDVEAAGTLVDVADGIGAERVAAVPGQGAPPFVPIARAQIAEAAVVEREEQLDALVEAFGAEGGEVVAGEAQAGEVRAEPADRGHNGAIRAVGRTVRDGRSEHSHAAILPDGGRE